MPSPANPKTYALLQPLAWIYGLVMKARNHRFDTGSLPVRSFGVPVISVGNLSVGGTGKTPMCVAILQILRDMGVQPALLSRGYGRRTKGYRCATPQSTAAEMGDEPMEVYTTFDGQMPVAVCEKRCAGAEQLLASEEQIGAIVLDDAYQHRYIDRNLNILLTDYNRLYTRDRILPAGRLRESAQGASRAQIIVVTKCPANLSRAEAEAVVAELQPAKGQSVFFTTICYEDMPIENLASKKVLIVTGIAKPEPLIEHYRARSGQVETMRFADHHAFTDTDIKRIEQAAAQADVVVTTNKDFQRMRDKLPSSLQSKMVVQRISVAFLFDQKSAFRSLVAEVAKPQPASRNTNKEQ